MSDAQDLGPDDVGRLTEVVYDPETGKAPSWPLAEPLVAGQPDANWPGGEYVAAELTCEKCGKVNLAHDQADPRITVEVEPDVHVQALEARHPVTGSLLGVDWECSYCGHRNNLGGEPPAPPDLYVLECGNCHSTFAPSKVPQEPDGTWVCEVCDTPNRNVHAGENGSGSTSSKVEPG